MPLMKFYTFWKRQWMGKFTILCGKTQGWEAVPGQNQLPEKPKNHDSQNGNQPLSSTHDSGSNFAEQYSV